MTFTLSGEQIVGGIITAAALVAAIAYFIVLGRRVSKWMKGLSAVVQHELTHNHGTSMKDDVHATAITVGSLARTVDQLVGDLEAFKTDFYHHLADQTTERTP